MANTEMNPVDLAGVEKLVATTDALVREALAVASKRTEGGKGIDDEQVHCERLAYAATEARGGARAADLRGGRARRSQPDPSHRRDGGAVRRRGGAEAARRRSKRIRTSSASRDERLNATLGVRRAARADPRRHVATAR